MKLNFSPQLIHLYGPFGIHSYGLFIALGIIVGAWALRYNKRFKQLHLEHAYLDIIVLSIISGCIGGRILVIVSEPHLYTNWHSWFALWEGGLSVLGSMLGVIVAVPIYLKRVNIPILPVFDLASIYAPLIQAIGRLGCFTAGCCYGTTTTSFFSVIYTNPNTLAPYGIAIHPTQIYSAVILFGIFLCMFFIAQHRIKKDGYLFALYIIAASLERFFIDFWRDDRIMITHYLSFHQIVALVIILVVTMIIIILHASNSKTTKNAS